MVPLNLKPPKYLMNYQLTVVTQKPIKIFVKKQKNIFLTKPQLGACSSTFSHQSIRCYSLFPSWCFLYYIMSQIQFTSSWYNSFSIQALFTRTSPEFSFEHSISVPLICLNIARLRFSILSLYFDLQSNLFVPRFYFLVLCSLYISIFSIILFKQLRSLHLSQHFDHVFQGPVLLITAFSDVLRLVLYQHIFLSMS